MSKEMSVIFLDAFLPFSAMVTQILYLILIIAVAICAVDCRKGKYYLGVL